MDLLSSDVPIQVDVRRGGDTCLACKCTQNLECKLRAGVSHRKRCRTGSGFRFDDFISSELDAVGEGLYGGLVKVGGEGAVGLGEKRDDLENQLVE